MKATIIGASGMVGGRLLNLLLQDTAVTSILSLVRRPGNLQHPKLREYIIDFNDEAAFTAAMATADADSLFCCVGTTMKKVKGDKNTYRKIDFDIPVRAARIAAGQAITCFVLVSAVGANSKSANFYLKLKGEAETAVSAQAVPSVYIMRPSLLLGYRPESRSGETVMKRVMRVLGIFLAGRLSRYRAIDADVVAQAMLSAAKKHERGRFICLYQEMLQLAGSKA